VVKLLPLGDTAVLAYLPDEAAAWRFAAAARAADLPGRLDVVQAYASVAVFFDPAATSPAAVTAALRRLDTTAAPPITPRRHELPCCYELNLDLARVAEHTGRTADDVIRLHTGTEYTVYAIGFCPGFPYLGYLPAELCGVPRLPAPRLRVEPGSVGLTGRQTGVYPLERPGGWNIVGRTPLVLADPADGYFPLRVGDKVCFRRVDDVEFRRLAGERLPPTASQK
jgi:inhibitor of KinA